MAEYIKREALVHRLKSPYLFNITPRIFEIISEIPAADVAPVVRCKDCKNWLPGGYKSIADPQNPQCGGRCWYSNISRLENDFCSYGERKEADNA